MIELNNVSKLYQNSVVLKNFTLTIEENGIYCLLGRNGAGKTTLLKSIAGYQNISEGSIRINGQPISTAAMDTGVSYIENFAKHYNFPVKKLLKAADEVNPCFDYDFALEMMERFELDAGKKFSRLSLGMKTMVSTIICLASSKPVVLLDEPVLGFDAIMRTEFYDLLTESYTRHPRIIIVSTHIIDEIAKVMEKLIIIDRGALRFYDTLMSVEEKAYSISGLKQQVLQISRNLHSIGEDQAGGLMTNYIFDAPVEPTPGIEIEKLSIQDFFIRMVGKKGGRES